MHSIDDDSLWNDTTSRRHLSFQEAVGQGILFPQYSSSSGDEKDGDSDNQEKGVEVAVDEVSPVSNVQEFVVLFLVMDYLHPDWNSFIRQRWGGVVHAKAPPATDSFDYRPFQIDSVDTKWGETIQAQRLLYRAALEKYPTAKYFFLLSGDTIPIRDIDTIEKTMHLIDSSVVQIMREVQWVDHKIKKEKKWTLINSHMNNVLVRKQVEFLASTKADEYFDAVFQWCTPGHRFNFNRDEFIISTALWNAGYLNENFDSRIIDFTSVHGECNPKLYDAKTKNLLDIAIQEAVDSGPEIMFFRKVRGVTMFF